MSNPSSMQPGVVGSVRVTHEYATVEEIADAGAESQRADVERLLDHPDVLEAFALQTCNRSEAYVVAPTPDQARHALDDFAPGVRDGAVVRSGHEDSLRHLLRVAAGLESVILGEDQILGQVRTAHAEAEDAGGLDRLLENAVTKAIHVGERARSETAINEGHTSLGSAAVVQIREERALEDATAVVVGAGEMGAVVARHLADAGTDLILANRTVSTAEHLAAAIADDLGPEGDGGSGTPAVDEDGGPRRPAVIALDRLPQAVADSDIVVTATGSQDPVIADLPAEATRDTLITDLGKPRDVAPTIAERPTVDYLGLDAIEDVTDRTRERRQQAAATVEDIVDEEFDQLLTQFKRQRADDAIAAMHESADRLKERELATARSRLESAGDLTDEQADIVASLADALTGKLLAPPTTSLRDAAETDDWDTIRTALELFDPDFADGAPSPIPDLSPPTSPEDGREGPPPGDIAGTTEGAGHRRMSDPARSPVTKLGNAIHASGIVIRTATAGRT